MNGDRHFNVDIPVTDLDELDDDIFEGQGGLSSEDHFGDALDELDYGLNKSSTFKEKMKTFFGKLKANRGYNRLASPNVTGFANDIDPDSDNFIENIRDYKIKMVYTKFRNMLYIGIGLIVALFLVGLYAKKSRNGRYVANYPYSKPLLNNGSHLFYPTTIVISLDGFHPHYINSERTPALHSMMVNNFGAPYMIPSFPSSTFPNHFTLVTGLYPSEHGIVGNTFFDPDIKKQFVNTDPKKGGLDPDFWKGAEAIWQTAFKQDVKTAAHMWPGSEVPEVALGYLSKVEAYNGSATLSSKSSNIIKWLDEEDISVRPQLILGYVPTIDQFGHKYGISGKELENSIRDVDLFVSLVLEGLKVRNLDNIVNLIVLSDHGMAPTSNGRLLYLDDIVDLKKIEHIDGWPLYGLRPFEEQDVESVVEEIRKKLATLPESLSLHYLVYLKSELPEEWNFGRDDKSHKFNYRLAPIWIIPDTGYVITTAEQMEKYQNDYKPKGVHGYNNTELLMRALFLAKGPYFNEKLKSGKGNEKLLPFQNTEIYNLVCDTINIEPSPNNGTFGHRAGCSDRPLFSPKNILPDNWTDPLIYPNLTFEVEHLVKDSTYDLLWKKPQQEEDTADNSEIPDASSLSSSLSSTTKPTGPSLTYVAGPGSTTSENFFDEVLDELVSEVEKIASHYLGDYKTR